MKALVIGIFFFANSLGFASTPHVVKDNQIEESIQIVLSQHRPLDTPDWWRDLGPRAPFVIMRMYTESRHPYRKIRLVAALGNYDTAEVAAFLKEVALSTTNSTMRRAAIRALGRSQGMREEAFLVRGLRSTNPHTRLAAAEALEGTGDRKAIALVGTYLKQEKSTWVVARLRKDGVKE